MESARRARRVELGVRRSNVEGDESRLVPRRPEACAVGFSLPSPEELSLFPEAPGRDRPPVMDIYKEVPAELTARARKYVRAIIAGQIDLTLHRRSSAARMRLFRPSPY